MKNVITHILTWIIICLFSLGLCAQNEGTDLLQEANSLKTKLKSEPFRISGNLMTDIRLNTIYGIERRADPFDFRMNGNLTIHTFGFSTQLNLNLSDGRVVHRLSRPDIKLPSYAFIGLSPSYKWLKLHLGFRSINLSQYTMNGTSFYGSGIELSPSKFRFLAFYGRLQRARPEQLDIPNSLEPLYKRLGWGIKTGYDNGRNNMYLVLFRAHDVENSIDKPIEFADVRPAENMILNLLAKKAISKQISVNIDYAWNGLTRNTTTDPIENTDDISWIYDFAGLYQPKVSTGFHKALKTSIELDNNIGKIDITHEKVDPGYRSLGALFFNNDFENITLGLAKSFLNKKIITNSRFGYQRNNLQNTETNTSNRFVFNTNINYSINQRLNLSGTFSNLASTNIYRVSQLPIVTEDSIILSQVNRNMNIIANYTQGAKMESIWTASFNYQQFNSITNDIVNTDQVVENIMLNLTNTYRFQKKPAQIGNSIFINFNKTSFLDLWNLSTSHSISKKWLDKKLNLMYIFSNSLIFNQNNFDRYIVVNRVQANYDITKKTNLNLSLVHTSQIGRNTVSNIPNFNEFSMFIKYGLKF